MSPAGLCRLPGEAERAICLEGRDLRSRPSAPAAPTHRPRSALLPIQLKHRASRGAGNMYASWGQSWESVGRHAGSTNTGCSVVQTSPLRRPHRLLQRGNDTERPCRSTSAVPAGRRADTYRKSSSFHSISAAAPALPAAAGLVCFCCGGLSSSATQRISPTPATEG